MLGLTGREGTAAETLSLAAPLPTAIPPGTRLSIADPQTQIALQASGGLNSLPFTPSWANLWVGPAVLQAFRARALDIAIVGGIPPLLAASTGLDLKIVGLLNRPVFYALATAPGSSIRAPEDLKGKKIAFSPGQEQGLFALLLLKQLGLASDQVKLINLTNPEFYNALASRQVDAAPMPPPALATYLGVFARDGAGALHPDIPTTPLALAALTDSLKDPAKAAAMRSYVSTWYAALIWEYENTDAWNDAFYVRSQHVSKADGQRIIDSLGMPLIPRNWDKARQIERLADDLFAAKGIVARLDVDALFDTRFESLAADAVPAKYLAA